MGYPVTYHVFLLFFMSSIIYCTSFNQYTTHPESLTIIIQLVTNVMQKDRYKYQNQWLWAFLVKANNMGDKMKPRLIRHSCSVDFDGRDWKWLSDLKVQSNLSFCKQSIFFPLAQYNVTMCFHLVSLVYPAPPNLPITADVYWRNLFISQKSWNSILCMCVLFLYLKKKKKKGRGAGDGGISCPTFSLPIFNIYIIWQVQFWSRGN